MLYNFDWVSKEMIEEIAYAEDRGEAIDRRCEQCPYHEICAKKGVYLDCALWAEYLYPHS